METSSRVNGASHGADGRFLSGTSPASVASSFSDDECTTVRRDRSRYRVASILSDDERTTVHRWLFRLSGGSFRLSWRDGGVQLTRYRRAAGPSDARHGLHRDAAGVGGSRVESGSRPSTGMGMWKSRTKREIPTFPRPHHRDRSTSTSEPLTPSRKARCSCPPEFLKRLIR